FGHDGDRGRAGVDAPLRLRLRHTLHAVDAALVLEARIGALAFYGDDHFLVAADTGLVLIDYLRLPAAGLGITRVHPQQVGSEDARLVAARPGANFDEDVLVVARILGDEQRAQPTFQPLQFSR